MQRSIFVRRSAARALVVLVLFALGCGGATTAVSNHLQEQLTFSSSRALDGSDAANMNSTRNIWVMNGDGTDARPLTTLTAQSADSYYPTWSPDGTKIAFSSSRALDGTDASNGTESADIWMMNADGTSAMPLTALTGGYTVRTYADWSPDGTRIAFQADHAPHFCSSYIFSVHVDGTSEERLDRCVSSDVPVWSPDGTELVYSAHRAGEFSIDFSFLNIVRANGDGTGGTMLTNMWFALSFNPVWSPDGTKIAFVSDRALDGSDARKSINIWAMNADGTGAKPLTRYTSSLGSSYEPKWSPDGTEIMFSSNRALDGSDALNTNSTTNIWLMNADGTGIAPLTKLTQADNINPVWSANGTKIAFDSERALDGSDAVNANGTTNIWVMNADGTGAKALAPITTANAHSGTPQWQP